MKKKFCIFSLLFAFTSCNVNKTTTILIGDSFLKEVSYVYDSPTAEISFETLKNKIENEKEDMIFCVYGSLTCSCWQHFVSNCLNKLVRNYKCPIYCVDFQVLKSNNEFFNLKGLSETGETFYLLNEGQDIFHKTYKDNDQFFKDYDTFFETIKNKIKFPKIKNELLSNIWNFTKNPNDNDTHILYYRKSSCPDCTYLERHLLKDYFLQNEIIDVSSIDLDGDEVDTYEGGVDVFKKDFGLTSDNSKFGFGKGFVPTFQVWKDGNIIDSLVVYNDTLVPEGDNYKVSSSFFSEERINNITYLDASTYQPIEGTIVDKDDVTSYEIDGTIHYSWNYESSSKVYSPYVESFFNKYLKIQ